jgi:hypothetical protein
MNKDLDPEYLPALEKLDALNELSLYMLERISFAGSKEILQLMAKRQELIDQLCELDVLKKRVQGDHSKALPETLQNEFNKLLAAGDVLIGCCTNRLREIEKSKRQSAVTRATARLYRPKYNSLSTGVVDI